jgi:3-deoxy-7-phosphoheptulonate synthase
MQFAPGTRHRLPTPKTVREKLPLTSDIMSKKAESDLKLQRFFSGVVPAHEKIVITGPCSAWPQEAVLEHMKNLAELRKRLGDVLFIVARVYIQKPRTNTKDWNGPLTQPDPFELPQDAADGIYYCREMMLKVAKMGLPIADEAMFTHNDDYFMDLISYLAVGARSTENPDHRGMASNLEIPVGLKNPTSGSIKLGVDSVISAQSPNIFPFHRDLVVSKGNPLAHLILRGGQQTGSNISRSHLLEALSLMKGVQNPSIILDASHDNTLVDAGNGKLAKEYLRQMDNLDETTESMTRVPEINAAVKGWMLESFEKGGSQKIPSMAYTLSNEKKEAAKSALVKGQSVTDGCLPIDALEKKLIEVREKLLELQKAA